MPNSAAPKSRLLPDYLKWRGSFIVSLLVFRQILRPFLYWHVWHIYETDFSQQVPEPYAREKVEVSLYTEDDVLPSIREKIVEMGELTSSEVDLRLHRGDAIGIAYVAQKAVGYMWLAWTAGFEIAFDTYWIIREGEAVRYGSFVIPEYRGRAIHSCLNAALNKYARHRGIVRTFSSVSLLNPQSMSVAKHTQRAVAMILLLVHIRGLNWTIRKAFGAPLESRFSWPHV